MLFRLIPLVLLALLGACNSYEHRYSPFDLDAEMAKVISELENSEELATEQEDDSQTSHAGFFLPLSDEQFHDALSSGTLRVKPAQQGWQSPELSWGYTALLPGVGYRGSDDQFVAQTRFIANATLDLGPIALQAHTLNDLTTPFSDSERRLDRGTVFSRTRVGVSLPRSSVPDLWLVADIRAVDEAGVLDVPVALRHNKSLFGLLGIYGYTEIGASDDIATASLFSGFDLGSAGELQVFLTADMPWERPEDISVFGELYYYAPIQIEENVRPYIGVQQAALERLDFDNTFVVGGVEISF